ncbi:MAG: DUF3703 domain-containing protein [Bdellovibrionales bacterium]|nr:DUF3703 domain-containing protein [Bdellovibrionales bacterium]
MRLEQSIRFEVLSLLKRAKDAKHEARFSEAWRDLEYAHIWSQPYAYLHVKVHWQMLVLAAQTMDAAEVWGQILRILVAGPGSILRKYPKGNTGRSNVSMFLPMPIPEHIKDAMRSELAE